jgi:hypothetical protein
MQPGESSPAVGIILVRRRGLDNFSKVVWRLDNFSKVVWSWDTFRKWCGVGKLLASGEEFGHF